LRAKVSGSRTRSGVLQRWTMRVPAGEEREIGWMGRKEGKEKVEGREGGEVREGKGEGEGRRVEVESGEREERRGERTKKRRTSVSIELS